MCTVQHSANYCCLWVHWTLSATLKYSLFHLHNDSSLNILSITLSLIMLPYRLPWHGHNRPVELTLHCRMLKLCGCDHLAATSHSSCDFVFLYLPASIYTVLSLTCIVPAPMCTPSFHSHILFFLHDACWCIQDQSFLLAVMSSPQHRGSLPWLWAQCHGLLPWL